MGDIVRKGHTLPRRRRFSGTWSTFSTLLRGTKVFQMSEGRRSQVVLLDERRLDLIIQSRLYGGELLDIVASHFNLKEKDYFGIAFIDDTGQYSWLSLDKRVLEHDFPKKNSEKGSTIILYFRIKYYIESITQLRDSATIEAFYLQTKSLIAKGELEIDADIIFQLAALVIQATYGDYTDEPTFKSHLKRLPVLPTSTLKEFPSISLCENKVLEHYQVLVGQTRGAAIVNYLSIVESLPTYGQHYYEIKDKQGNGCWLGLSYRGISQYDKNDRKTPRRVFFWKQLENLYFRDRKFTIEVHEARRVVHTLSSFNLYEDAIEEPLEEFDDLSNAICDPTTQVSVSRRALAPANVFAYVWYASSPNAARCIWSMAISQHQFFLDRNQKKSQNRVNRSLSQIASELCRSVQSLSSASSHSNISRSNSSASLPTIVIEGEVSEESRAATLEMLTALQSRKDALQEALKKKTEELKALCLKEGEITGELPPETPYLPGEAQPQVRRRIGTSFTISDKIIYRAKGKDRETLNDLELDYEIQSKIASAAFKLANDVSARKSVRKMRKLSYQQATTKLRDIEQKISTLKREKDSQKKESSLSSSSCKLKLCAVSDNRLNYVGLPNSSSENSIPDRSSMNSALSNSAVPPSSSLPHLVEGISTSAPPSPPKNRQRHQSLQHVPAAVVDDTYEEVAAPFSLCPRRDSSSFSAASEYDAVSCGSSSVASLGIPYRNRFETHLDIEGTNHYSVPNRRASQVFNDTEDFLLDDKCLETQSQCYVDMTQSKRSVHTPLSCSYDERLTFIQSDYSIMDKTLQGSDYDKACMNSNETLKFSNADISFKVPYAKEPVRRDTFPHSHSVNSLHRAHMGSLHGSKINEVHLSDPDLNADSVDGHGTIRHGYSVPTLKNTLRPYNSGLAISLNEYSGANHSINQVVDLVQASVLLQESKRAASCNPEVSTPKTKTKEWTETSLDSPLVIRKRKPKISESSSELSQPAQWLDNGLPPEPAYNYQSSRDLREDSRIFLHKNSDMQDSPPHVNQNMKGNCCADYRPLSSASNFSLHIPTERPHSSLNRNLFPENNPYRLYENIDDLSFQSSSKQVRNGSYYENIDHIELSLNNSTKMPDLIENTIHNARHINIREDNFDEIHSACPAIAQPQEPSKHLKRSPSHQTSAEVNLANHDYCNLPPDNDYEPIEFGASTHRVGYHQAHCDIRELSHPYSASHRESPKISEIIPENAPPIQQWPSVVEKPESSVPSSVNLPSPSVSLTPAVEVNVVSMGHFQPYWEETKPYELSDFYKYSTKHRRQQSAALSPSADDSLVQHCTIYPHEANHQFYAANSENMNCDYSPQGPVHINMGKIPKQIITSSSVPIFDSQEHIEVSTKYYKGDSPAVPVMRHPEDPDKSLSLGEIDLQISLADTFHDEMVSWYQNQDSVKKATLV
ncbi:uncharacterized protein [Parasteatoda tepidariorum]|uniref:uncharacterized protein isoform X4 n=2 Tax=Parasteatoda tepidariorum TaxID=114398 RepID=UPI000A2C0C34|nr:uncharacterized protein LOC107442702 isoform X4 [Parasteatoda tepidariorum]